MLARHIDFILRHRRATIVATICMTALLASQTLKLRLDVRESSQVPQDHPYVQIDRRVSEVFGGQTTVVVRVFVSEGDIYTPGTLAKIRRLTRAIDRLPDVVAGKTLSIAADQVKAVAGDRGGLDIHPFLPSRIDASAAGRVREDVERDRVCAGLLVSADGRAAAIVAELVPDVHYPSAHAATSLTLIPALVLVLRPAFLGLAAHVGPGAQGKRGLAPVER